MSAFTTDRIAFTSWMAATSWTAVIGFSLWWGVHQEEKQVLEQARIQAATHINKDLAFRRWATSHGGVYVKPTERTPPNPYIVVPDRDVVTTGGKKLTLMNPAYMMRQIMGDFAETYGTRGHITAIKLLNPGNAPDDWERNTLLKFEHGARVAEEIVDIGGKRHLRLMHAMIMEDGCVPCHGHMGFKTGDVRGGISTSVSLAPFELSAAKAVRALAVGHGAIWLMGLLGIGFVSRRARNYQEQLASQAESLRLTQFSVDRAADAVFWLSRSGRINYVNDAACRLVGYPREELQRLPMSHLNLHQDEEAWQAHWEDLRKHGSLKFETSLMSREGLSIPVDISANYLEFGGEAINCVYARDMSGWKAQQAEMARLKTLLAASFDQSRIPMMLVSLPDGFIEIANRASQELLPVVGGGNPAGKGLGEYRPGYKLFDATGRLLTLDSHPLFRAARGESIASAEYRMLFDDGTERWIMASGGAILDERGKTLAAFVTFPDITSLKQAEQAVRDSHRQFQAIMDNMDALVYVADMDNYEILFMNRMGRDLFGEYAGRICWQTIQQGQTGPCSFCTNNRLLDSAGRPNPPYVWEFQNTVTGKWFRCSDQAIRWIDGRLVRMEIAVDITESMNATVALQESEQRFRKLFEKAPLAYQSLDMGAHILEVNDTWLDLFGGYTREEIIGRSIAEFLEEQSQPVLNETFPAFISSGHVEGPVFEIRRKDGGKRLVTVNGRVAYDNQGNPQLTHCMLTDITERQRAERALREHAEQMERLYQEQREFAFVASHDLQEPLRKILIFGDRLANNLKSEDSESLDYLGRMRASASRMQRLIDGLLDYSRVTLKEKNLQAVSLAAVVSDVLSDLEGRVSQSGAQVEVGVLPNLQADSLQMHQLFQNLIANALKFTRPGVVPHVRIWSEQEGSGDAGVSWRIHVADNGIGFDERYKEKIFEIFERLDASQTYEGTGVGLSLCRKIAEQHGGTIEASGKPGQGAVFTVVLPEKPVLTP